MFDELISEMAEDRAAALRETNEVNSAYDIHIDNDTIYISNPSKAFDPCWMQYEDYICSVYGDDVSDVVCKPLSITPEQIRETLKDAVLSYNKEYGVEEGEFVPILAKAFYRYIFEYGRIPTEREFQEFYLAFNMGYFFPTDDGRMLVIRQGRHLVEMPKLNNRISRAYASLIREFDVYLRLCKELGSDVCFYSIHDDVDRRTDIVLYDHKNLPYYVGLNIDTSNGNGCRDRKVERHQDGRLVNYYGCNLSAGERLNGWKGIILYPQSSIEKIVSDYNETREIF